MATESIYISIGNSFLELMRTFNACTQKILSKYGLYPGQPQMLFAIKELENPTQNDLALKLKISKSSAGISLRRLEAAGFVKRVRDRHDTRCIRIKLTDKGAEFARWCAIDFEMLFTTLLESFNSNDLESINAYVPQMNINLTSLKDRLNS